MISDAAAIARRLYEDFKNDEIFARESLMVQNKQGELIPMHLGPAQKKAAELRARLRERNKPVRVIVLKARQVWMSNYITVPIWRDTAHQAGQNAMIVAHSDESASDIFGYYQRFDSTYKPFRGKFAKPARSNDSTQELVYRHGQVESTIRFRTAKTVDFARGKQLRRVHLSEFAFYGDGAKKLLSATMAAMAKDADTEAWIESTANGLGNEFYALWKLAEAGETDWVPFFFGWTEHPEYTMPLDVRADVFQESLSDYERDLMRIHRLTLEQLNWRRWVIRNEESGDEELFKQEYPATPEEAFLNSGRPRFDLKAIERMPVVRDAMEGQLEVNDLGGEKRLCFAAAQRGPLVIYRQPQPGRSYLLGCDVAEGIDASEGKGTADPDYCVAQVGDRDSGEVVARLRARMTPAEFARHTWRLGAFYNWAQICAEVNNQGLAFLYALTGEPLNYPKTLIYHRDAQPDEDPTRQSDLIGFKTTPLTRPQIIDGLHEAIRQFLLHIHDPITLSECRTFVIKPNGKAEAAYKCHDDTVLALALLWFGMVRMPRRKPPEGEFRQTGRAQYGQRGDSEIERLRRLRLQG